LERDLLELQYSEELDEQEAYYSVTPRRIAQIVSEVSDDVAELDNQPGRSEYWRHVSTHDLRRYFAQTLLVRENKNPRVVMRIGGWSSMDALEPYLNRPTPEVVASEMRD
jgi:integrase